MQDEIVNTEKINQKFVYITLKVSNKMYQYSYEGIYYNTKTDANNDGSNYFEESKDPEGVDFYYTDIPAGSGKEVY